MAMDTLANTEELLGQGFFLGYLKLKGNSLGKNLSMGLVFPYNRERAQEEQ